MPKTKISEFSSTPANNTDIDSINIAEGCAPSGINDAIRELMAQLKDFQTGAAGDSFNGPVGTSTAAAGAFTTLSASSTVTLSGGTANGVLYLNGSKVVTSGSALSFDGTSLNVGSATFPDGRVRVKQASDASKQKGLLIEAAADDSLLAIGYDGSAFTFNPTYNTTGGYKPMAWWVSGSEQMRLTSTGLGIGTSSPAGKLHVNNNGVGQLVIAYNGTSVNYYDADTQVFRNGAATERARIDSSGNLLVGTTSGDSPLCVYTTSVGGTVGDFRNNAASGNCVVLYPRMTQTGSTSNYFFAGQSNSVDKVYIYGNGNIVNSNNSYGSLSDIKLKENITDATPKLVGLMQVRVVNYNLIGETNKQLGVVAQELEQVFPAMIDESPDRDAEGNDLGTTTKSVKYSVFVPMLIKAMQEQQAIIDSLKARLDAANL